MTNGTGDRLDRLEALVEENQRQITANSQAIAQLADLTAQVVQRVDNQIAVITQQQTAMNAELERQGRILDYLVRRNGGSQPQS